MSNKPLTDEIAFAVEKLWKDAFPVALLFPGIGLPSQDNGVLFLTHILDLGKVMKINGLPSSSPVSSYSLYSAENIKGKTFNIYEVQIPDIPGKNGNPSTGDIYVQALSAEGLTVTISHFHWTGAYFFDGKVHDHNVAAIHHQQYDMDPILFSQKTIRALLIATKAIKDLVGTVIPDVIDNSKCCISDKYAKKILNLWKKSYPDTFILPVVGEPSKNKSNVAVYSHTLADESGPAMLMKVNGLEVKSPLANNALYSFECTRGKFLHFYEIMFPDIPGEKGERSTVQIYVNALRDNGLDVAGVHFHFYGGVADENDRGVFAIHHQNVGMSPEEFSRATIKSLETVEEVIKERAAEMVQNKSTKMIKSTKSARKDI